MIIGTFSLVRTSVKFGDESLARQFKLLSFHNPIFYKTQYIRYMASRNNILRAAATSSFSSTSDDYINVPHELVGKSDRGTNVESTIESKNNRSTEETAVTATKPASSSKRKQVDQYLVKYHDMRSYLKHAKLSGASTNSTVFQGNLYELSVLEFLRNTFDISKIIHQGGKDDKGIDIRADWNLGQIKRTVQDETGIGNKKGVMELVNATKRIKPLAYRKNSAKSLNVKLFVQCKCWTKSRIDAKMVREINGTYANTVPNSYNPSSTSKIKLATPNNVVFFMMFSPTGFTRQGRIDFDSSMIPLIHVNFSRTQLGFQFNDIKTKGLEYNEAAYDYDNYIPGEFESVYCNPTAQALLKGLDWTDLLTKSNLNMGIESDNEDSLKTNDLKIGDMTPEEQEKYGIINS